MGKKITPQNFGIALGQYLEQELAPQSSGLQKVALYLALPVVINKAPQMLEQYKGLLALVDGVAEDGNLELDVVYKQVKEAMHKAGKIPVMGIIFDETDIDKIYAHATPLATG